MEINVTPMYIKRQSHKEVKGNRYYSLLNKKGKPIGKNSVANVFFNKAYK